MKILRVRCRWSPFNEIEFKGTPVATIIAGKTKMKLMLVDGKILGEKHRWHQKKLL